MFYSVFLILMYFILKQMPRAVVNAPLFMSVRPWGVFDKTKNTVWCCKIWRMLGKPRNVCPYKWYSSSGSLRRLLTTSRWAEIPAALWEVVRINLVHSLTNESPRIRSPVLNMAMQLCVLNIKRTTFSSFLNVRIYSPQPVTSDGKLHT